jgi:UDP-N-acetylmuramate dehydrogenase
MVIIKENISAKDFSTFCIGGTIRYFCTVGNIAELQGAIDFAKEKKVPIIIVGEGSNTIWRSGEHDILAISLAIKNISVVSENAEHVVWQVGAGVNWDALVKKTVAENLWGIECMSGIPGTVGAAPVQNIGAYGQELKDIFVSCEVYDLAENQMKTLSYEDCKFSYRDSVFKSTQKGRYIILSVQINLSKKQKANVSYESLQKYFYDRGIVSPALSDIRKAVLEIRSTKLPNPKDIPNCGSFFENPIITLDSAKKLQEKFPDMKIFPTDKIECTKIPAGWLIEKAGFKGKQMGNICVYKNNALVLTNTGGATFDELIQVKNQIIFEVKNMFGVELEMEPNVI